jgi:flagellar biosynthetic protein FliP
VFFRNITGQIVIPTFKFRTIRFSLALLSAVGFLMATHSSLCAAQQPSLNGWGTPTNRQAPLANSFESQVSVNRPSTFNLPQSNPAVLPNNPPTDVRQQIGLATFDEPWSAPKMPVDEPQSKIAQPNIAADVSAQPDSSQPLLGGDLFSSQTEQLTSREGLASSIKVALLLATLSLAPAIVLMTTSYVRVIVVLTLLKQAFGAQQLPPTQVLTALSMFITLLVMTPVWNQVKKEAIDPYTQSENGISWEEAWARGVVPVKTFMTNQIEAAGNGESVALFYKYLPEQSLNRPESAADVPISVLLPAFLISELKVAFLLGFQIFLPFLVLDLVVSSVTVSTGMVMLPPTMVSFPLKLILFVLVDGWNLVVGMLLQSFAPFT